jgi:hypothetical protein
VRGSAVRFRVQEPVESNSEPAGPAAGGQQQWQQQRAASVGSISGQQQWETEPTKSKEEVRMEFLLAQFPGYDTGHICIEG